MRTSTDIAALYASQAAGGKGSITVKSKEEADKVAKDFEANFLSQMMEQMYGDSVGEEAFGDQNTDDIYKGLVMEQYGNAITRAGGIGIADYVKRELLKIQEIAT